MNLLVLATGGTIGSAAGAGGIDADGSRTPLLLQMYRARYGGDVRFTPRQICTLLSENADRAFYETLLAALFAAMAEPFDGVIVLHGTDTLPFTASLAAMACRHFTKPVCFVSSVFELCDPRENGVSNLRAAVRYIEAGGAGFVVPFGQAGGECRVHLATRLLEADPFTDDFASAGAPAAVVAGDEVRFARSADVPDRQTLRRPLPALFAAPPRLPGRVVLLRCFPGMCPQASAVSADTAAVLLWGYHSGTAPQRLTRFVKQVQAAGAAVYLAPVKRAPRQYASTNALLESGARPLYALSAPAAYARLLLAYAQTADAPESAAQRTLYYEEVPAHS
ncbi:MAG TPA: asparaginase [Candidatus Fimenecus excrementigallinarum]|uniref:asparaginase n=1 Tax=Candidatus Fimenecus excrementigallinarum TaxID=2840816 RepID=A0A9D1IGF6_9FIRM|nr:asparaginase [Candidatus Fimenecus excrementigallinarum]